MENQSVNPVANPVIKRQIVRSASYPGNTIKDNLEFTTKVYRLNPSANYTFTLDSITGVIPSGALSREFAAAKEYGFIIKAENGEYKISPLFKKLYAPIGNEFKEGMIEAFQNPKLYKALIEKYAGNQVPVEELPKILFKYHDISEKMSQPAADVFIQNAIDAGVLNDGRILNLSGNSGQMEQPLGGEHLLNLKDEKQPPIPPANKPEEPLRLPLRTGMENEVIKLTEGLLIDISYPVKMNTTQIAIFEKWMEMFKLRMQ